MLPLAAIIAGSPGFNGTGGDLQYFALLSTDGDFAAAVAALPNAMLLGSASHDSDVKIYSSTVTDAELNGTAALAKLRAANYQDDSNALCRHCWTDSKEFTAFGWHMLGLSENSYEGVASRTLVHVGMEEAGNADGTTYRDRISWATLDGTGMANGTSYLRHGKIWESRTNPLNSRNILPIATGGAATDAGSINDYGDANRTPCLMIDGQDLSQGNRFASDIGWTATTNLFGANTFVKSTLGASGSFVINGVSLMLDAGGADPFASMTTLEDHFLEEVSSAAGLSAEMTFFTNRTSSDTQAAPYGAPDAAIQDDGGAYTDYTTEAGNATTDDVVAFPSTAATDDAFLVGHSEIWSCCSVVVSTAGVGGYTLTPEYWNGSSWSAIPAGIWENGNSNFDAAETQRYFFNPPDDWATTTINSQGPYYYIRFRYSAGTMSTSPVVEQVWAEGTFFVVYLKDGATPTTVLPGDGLGVGVAVRQSSRPGQYQLINVSMLGADNVFDGAAGSGYAPSIWRILGGRFLYGGTGYQNGQMDEWRFGKWHRAGPWDTSDLPNYSNDNDVRAHVDYFGYSQSNWSADAQARKPHFRYFTVGPHYSQNVTGGTESGPPDYWPCDGLIIGKTGYAFKGISKSSNNDMHDLAARGGLDLSTASTWDGLYLYDGHAHVYFYATSDTNDGSPINGNCQDIGALTIQDSIIAGIGTETPTAGHFALRFGGDSGNGNLRDNGNGVRDITLDGISCVDIQPPTGYDNNAAVDWNWDQAPTIGSKGLRFVRGTRGICGGGANTVSKLYVVTEDNGTGFTDRTATAYGGSTFDAFPATPAADDAIYFGYSRWPFMSGTLTLDTSGIGSGLSTAWEYWDGSSWSALSNVTDNSTALTAATGAKTFQFDRPTDWATTDDSGNLIYDVYWIRLRITAGSYSTVPQLSTCQGPQMGGYLKITTAGQLYFEDMEGPWMGVRGLNAGYSLDRRTVIFDRFTGRLKSGETIATFNMFWLAGSGTDAMYTLSDVKGGDLGKALISSNAIEAVSMAANVSTTPGVDIEEV